MPRQRSKLDQWMPERVYRGRSAYEWKPKGFGVIRLCKLTASHSEVWAAYEKAYDDQRGAFNMSRMIDLYFASADFKELAPRTQLDYRNYSVNVKDVFGKASPIKITMVHIRKYMDARANKSRVGANRERSFMNTVFSWGSERGYCDNNPTKGVKTFKEKARQRYVTDQEFMAVYDIAPPNVRAAMLISYLCAARFSDVLALETSQILDDGVFIRQGKTGKEQIKAWSDNLKIAVQMALDEPSTIKTKYIIHTRQGQKYTRSGFSALYKRRVQKAFDEGWIKEKFTFHDLKRKGISDYEGNIQEFSGHLTAAMADRYDVKVKVTPTLGSDKLN